MQPQEVFFRDKGCGCVIKLGYVCFYMLMIPYLAGNKFIPIFEVVESNSWKCGVSLLEMEADKLRESIKLQHLIVSHTKELY